MSETAGESPDAGKGAYRKEPLKYIGVIVNERRRRVSTNEFVQEYGIRNQLGAVMFVAKDLIQLGEVIEQTETAPQVGASGSTPPVVRMAMTGGVSAARTTQGAPTSVKVLGGFWIAIAVLMTLSGLLAIIAHSAISAMQPEGAVTSAGMDSYLRFHKFMSYLQFAAGMLGFYSAIRFIQLKAWARASLEYLTWFGLIMLFLGMYGQWNAINADTSGGMGTGVALIFFGFMAVVAGVPAGVLIFFLRKDYVRDAMQE